jgi:SulP family sulfate permease
VGVILALLNFFRRMTAAVGVRALDGADVADLADGITVPEGIIVYRIDGPFFFGAVEQFEAALLHTHTEPRAVVIGMSRVPFVDLSALASLEETIDRLTRRGIDVAISCASPAVAERLLTLRSVRALPIAPCCTLAEALDAIAGASAPKE